MKLQDQLNAYKKSFLEKAPQDAVDTMRGATEALAESGILDRAVKVGDSAPAFDLENTEGHRVDLSGLVAKGPLVLTFFRGKW